MRLVAQWTPRLIYFGIVIYVGIRILSFYGDYFKQINDVIDMK
jgi:hypothetical protein